MIQVKIINNSHNQLPEYKTKLSAGMDIQADIKEDIRIEPNGRAIIKTGIIIEIPEGYECQIRPRSGLAAKHGITVLNSPGTIDADYRGEIMVILSNTSDEAFYIHNGDRIAQMVFAKVETAQWEVADKLGDTERGEGGLGHTGV